MAWVITHLSLIFAALWGLSEGLALIPQIESNSVFQLIYNWMKVLRQKFFPPAK